MDTDYQGRKNSPSPLGGEGWGEEEKEMQLEITW
jgi:hypothetical protein